MPNDLNPQQLASAQHLPADLMLVKMEGEHIMTMAATRRRSIAEVIKESCALLEANPLAAQQAVYSKPVGLKPDRCRKCGHQVQRKGWQKFEPRCPRCGGKNENMIAGKMQYARGLSIRAAESLRSVVGFNRLGSSVTREAEGLYKISVIFTDYANGIITSDEDFVSQYAKSRDGGLYKQDDVRFMEMTLKAAKSKTKRNVVRDSLPHELRQAYEAKAMEIAPKFLTVEKVNEIIEAFAEQGITIADLQVLVGKTKSEGWTKAEYETLRGTWTALDNGEMTVDELLNECRQPASHSENGQEDPPTGEAAAEEPKAAPKKATGTTAAVASELTGSSPPNESASDSGKAYVPVESETITVEPPKTRRKAAESKSESKPSETGKAPAEPAKPASETKTEPAKPVAAPKAPADPAQKKLDDLTAYMRARWEEECQEFDLMAIARAAITQRTPRAFIDGIMGKLSNGWQNYQVAGESAEEAAAEATDSNGNQDKDWPEYVRDPLARPSSMEDNPGLDLEKKLLTFRKSKDINKFLKEEVSDQTHLQMNEIAYLEDLGKRRGWYYDRNQAAPKELEGPGAQ